MEGPTTDSCGKNVVKHDAPEIIVLIQFQIWQSQPPRQIFLGVQKTKKNKPATEWAKTIADMLD
jgi:hypothetical protein